MTEEERRAVLDGADSKDAPLSRRLIAISAHFLGTPYVVSPLGEGSGKDPDPLIRFDAVDCLTFVEETMALGLAASADEVQRILAQIRYSDRPTYEERNHLMEAQWIPNNARKGFLKSVTRRYAGAATREVWKQIDERTWTSKSSRALGLPREARALGRFPLSMVRLEELASIAPRLDSGTVLIVIREDRPLRATRVSHVGFVVQRGQRTYLRHATRTFNRVVDEDLQDFMARNARYDRWKVVGVSLFEVTAPSDPVERVPAANVAQP